VRLKRLARVIGLPPVAGNTARLVLLAAVRNWRRNVATTTPAIATLALLLLVAGLFTLLGIAAAAIVAVQAEQAAVLNVYLRSDISQSALDALKDRLESNPEVSNVTYLTSEGVLARARSRPGLRVLLSGDDTSPFPAELDVKVRSVAAVAAVADQVAGDPAVDPAYPSSYDAGTYARLQRFLAYAKTAGAALFLILLGVSLAVGANAIRAAILARRDEVRIMGLLGSPGWVVSGPFVVEGGITGVVAGTAAGLVVAACFAAFDSTWPATVSQLLPGIDLGVIARLILALPIMGVAVGSISAALGLRGLRSQ